MKEKIDEEFSPKVDFSQEKDLFHRYSHVEITMFHLFTISV